VKLSGFLGLWFWRLAAVGGELLIQAPAIWGGGPSKNNSLFFLCCAPVNSLICSPLIPCSDIRRKQVQWLEIGSGCGFPRSSAQFEAPENAKFPVFFPVSRENAGRARFASDCVHRQPVVPNGTPSFAWSGLGLPGTSRAWVFPSLAKKRQRIRAGTARPAMRLPACVRLDLPTVVPDTVVDSRKTLNVIENLCVYATSGWLAAPHVTVEMEEARLTWRLGLTAICCGETLDRLA